MRAKGQRIEQIGAHEFILEPTKIKWNAEEVTGIWTCLSLLPTLAPEVPCWGSWCISHRGSTQSLLRPREAGGRGAAGDRRVTGHMADPYQQNKIANPQVQAATLLGILNWLSELYCLQLHLHFPNLPKFHGWQALTWNHRGKGTVVPA